MIEIIVDTSEFEASLDQIGELETSIFQDARSPSGFPYFYPVDLGRGPVVAKNAKALKITLPDGSVIFRKSAGPSAPRNIRLESFAQFDGAAINASISARGTTIRGWCVSFLNFMALYFKDVLADHTPVSPLPGGGKLQKGYRSTIIS